MTEKRDAYVQKIKAKLDEWNAEIDKLQAMADQTKPGTSGKYRAEKMPERSRILFGSDSGVEYRFSEVENGSRQ